MPVWVKEPEMRMMFVFVCLSLVLLGEHAQAQSGSAFDRRMRLNALEDRARQLRSHQFSPEQYMLGAETANAARATENLVREQQRANALAEVLANEQRKTNTLRARQIEEQKRANDLKERELLLAQARDAAQAKAQAAELARKQAELNKPTRALVPVAPAPATQMQEQLVQEQRTANEIKQQESRELTMFLGITTVAVIGMAAAIGGALSYQIRACPRTAHNVCLEGTD
jgi:hypothetical protein